MRSARVVFTCLLSGCQLLGYDTVVSRIADQDSGVVSHELDAGTNKLVDANMVVRADAAEASVLNACGGDGALSAAPDDHCGKCGLGTYVCRGTDSLVCNGGDALPSASGTYLIDDYEDGNEWTATGDGYSYAYGDGTEGHLEPVFHIEPVLGGAAGTKYAAHVKGGGFTDYGGGMIIRLNTAECTFDASAERGLDLYIKGPANLDLRLSIATPATRETSLCGAQCGDFHGTKLTLNGDWQHAVLQFRNLKQEGFGPAVALDTTQMQYIQLALPANADFELYVDEVSFY